MASIARKRTPHTSSYLIDFWMKKVTKQWNEHHRHRHWHSIIPVPATEKVFGFISGIWFIDVASRWICSQKNEINVVYAFSLQFCSIFFAIASDPLLLFVEVNEIFLCFAVFVGQIINVKELYAIVIVCWIPLIMQTLLPLTRTLTRTLQRLHFKLNSSIAK